MTINCFFRRDEPIISCVKTGCCFYLVKALEVKEAFVSS